jgi:hypothetical protein
MRRKLWHWKRSWSKLTVVSTLALSSADLAAAAEQEAASAQTDELFDLNPSMSVGEDRFDKNLKLNLALQNPMVVIEADGTVLEPMRFYLYNNYPSLIKSSQITIYDGEDKNNLNPIQIIPGNVEGGWVEWSGRMPVGREWKEGRQYKAILEVVGTDGKQDVVHPLFFRTISVSDGSLENFKAEVDPHELPGYGVDRTAHRGILPATAFGKAVVQASNLYGAQDITLNGVEVQADRNGRLVRELVLEPGTHKMTLNWTDEFGQKQTKEDTITIEKGKKKDFFFVGMADITASKNRVSGPGSSVLAADERFDGRTHWDSRIMFYMKGDVGERTRLTAHADTGEDKLENMFKKIGDRDPRRFSRELRSSAKEMYPIYGDNSTTVSDVDTEGKFYLRLERDKTSFLWGNYTSDTQDTELAAYNRSLYGAQIKHESKDLTKFGSPKNYATLFAAIGETRGAHNEFASTGGSLYYLKHQRVTQGSLQLKAELRDQNTGRVISTRTLQEGLDYEVDSFQGRVMLTKPLSMTSSSGSIISGSGILGGDNVFLVADYEYYSDGFGMDGQNTFGGRVSAWGGDNFRIGGSYIQEEKEAGGHYKLYGVDATIRPLKGTYTNLEYVQTKSSLADIWESSNGGISFGSAKTNGDAKDGKAFKVEQVINFSEFTSSEIPLVFEGYYAKKDAGFANFVDAVQHDTTEYGAELSYDWRPNGERKTTVKHTFEKQENQYYERITSILHQEEWQSGLRGTVEVQDRREKQYAALGQDTTRETLAAIKVEKDFAQGKHKVYGIVQGTLSREGDVEDNNKVTLGFESQVTKKLRLGLEGFTSNRGNGGGVIVNYDVNDRASIYTKVTSDLDSNAGREINTTVGTLFKPTSKMELYSERQSKSLQAEKQTSDIYGVRYKPGRNHNLELSYSAGEVKRRIDTGISKGRTDITDRDVWLLGYGYENSSFQYQSKLEYRRDRGAENMRQWVTTNRLKTAQSKNWSWLAQFDYAKTKGDNNASLADFTEAAVGFAYRPIKHDRLNLFGKITFISGLDPEDQFNVTDSTYNSRMEDDYEQRSLVYSLEGVYEFSPKLEMAFKAAHREGELRYRGENDWFSSGATLYAVRGNYKINKDWQAQLEYRHLEVDTAQDSKAGWVTSLYRNLGSHAKIGLGYNWTDYNDDLTRLNYNSKGWFVNLVGKW